MHTYNLKSISYTKVICEQAYSTQMQLDSCEECTPVNK